MCQVFFWLLFCIGIYFKHIPSTVFVLYSNSALDFHVEGNRKLQWVFVFGSDCPKQWRIFLFSLGDWKGTHVTEHRLPLCLISHFLYSSERVLTLKDVPSTLARSLVEVIAQHTNQKAKLKKRKTTTTTKTLNSYCLLPLTKPWGVSLLPCSLSSYLCW